MNWRLLDIRIGRANRQQFWLVLLWFFSMNLLALQMDIHYSKYIVFLFTFYILLLTIIRRVRDTGIKMKNALKILIFILGLHLTYYLILLLFENFSVHNVILHLLSFVLIVAYGGAKISTLLITLFLPFYKGRLVRNDYGEPPKGLDFNTMISNNTGKAP